VWQFWLILAQETPAVLLAALAGDPWSLRLVVLGAAATDQWSKASPPPLCLLCDPKSSAPTEQL
jgi:hypothetical protein